eukprot:TRINITY_DN12281_c1_g6_i2.p1 TRINITY_DN12281_c1_g6~~TRINITY_DN12281_c1_g6_i2.p1  ORF type:complete len:221 (+),score=13.90 TRINITY_DN12281_c1_g6_i2:76-738(+)
MSPKPAKKAKRERQLDGIPETQALRMTIPDYIQDDLNVLFCGINPGVWSAARGHHYAGPGNHFWPCLSHSFTNSVIRTTRGSTDLSKDELVAGGKRLRLIIEKHQPKIACFNGKGMFEAFIGRRCKFYGVQPERIGVSPKVGEGCLEYEGLSLIPRDCVDPQLFDFSLAYEGYHHLCNAFNLSTISNTAQMAGESGVFPCYGDHLGRSSSRTHDSFRSCR